MKRSVKKMVLKSNESTSIRKDVSDAIKFSSAALKNVFDLHEMLKDLFPEQIADYHARKQAEIKARKEVKIEEVTEEQKVVIEEPKTETNDHN